MIRFEMVSVIDAASSAVPQTNPTEVRVYWIGSGALGMRPWKNVGGAWTVDKGNMKGIATFQNNVVQKSCFVSDASSMIRTGSTSFTSTYHTAAHEIGHVLGLFHVNLKSIGINTANRRTVFGDHLMVEGGGYSYGFHRFLNKKEWDEIHLRLENDFEGAYD